MHRAICLLLLRKNSDMLAPCTFVFPRHVGKRGNIVHCACNGIRKYTTENHPGALRINWCVGLPIHIGTQYEIMMDIFSSLHSQPLRAKSQGECVGTRKGKWHVAFDRH
jgi:hypothetical protein